MLFLFRICCKGTASITRLITDRQVKNLNTPYFSISGNSFSNRSRSSLSLLGSCRMARWRLCCAARSDSWWLGIGTVVPFRSSPPSIQQRRSALRVRVDWGLGRGVCRSTLVLGSVLHFSRCGLARAVYGITNAVKQGGRWRHRAGAITGAAGSHTVLQQQ